MNRSIIRFILGYIVGFMGLFLLLPLFVALIYHEKVWFDYAIVSFPCLIIGLINGIKKPSDTVFYLKEGFFCTGAAWVILSIIGAIPLYISGKFQPLSMQYLNLRPDFLPQALPSFPM